VVDDNDDKVKLEYDIQGFVEALITSKVVGEMLNDCLLAEKKQSYKFMSLYRNKLIICANH